MKSGYTISGETHQKLLQQIQAKDEKIRKLINALEYIKNEKGWVWVTDLLNEINEDKRGVTTKMPKEPNDH